VLLLLLLTQLLSFHRPRVRVPENYFALKHPAAREPALMTAATAKGDVHLVGENERSQASPP
jgi:hypothetical protein